VIEPIAALICDQDTKVLMLRRVAHGSRLRAGQSAARLNLRPSSRRRSRRVGAGSRR
jgi:hypothetical protein